ncbi:Uncharacterized protein TCM_029477 [Theobroma cacao]|uniref:Uncharacterized protein n=1 Tax=Theobroma cacao TaxID=3641 RepID=A0A061GCX7_THECC|nr:Uncharacterized protein TCM_029477 [Theobroma cacao]
MVLFNLFLKVIKDDAPTKKKKNKDPESTCSIFQGQAQSRTSRTGPVSFHVHAGNLLTVKKGDLSFYITAHAQITTT